MTSNLYVLYDKVENRYSINVTHAPTDGACVRSALPELKKLGKNLDELELYCIGSYDLDDGSICETEKRLVPWTSYKAPETPSTPITPQDFAKTQENISIHSGDNFDNIGLKKVEELSNR